MADKDGTSRRKKKAKRQTIRVPSDEVPRRPATGPTMAVVRPDDEDDDLGLDGSIEVRLTPVPDPPGPLIPDAPQARQKTIVDMELPAGLLEMFGEPDGDGPLPGPPGPVQAKAAIPPPPASEDPGDLAVEVEVVDGEAGGTGASVGRALAKAFPKVETSNGTEPSKRNDPIAGPSSGPAAPARPFAPVANAGPVVVVSPIRSVGEPIPAPAPPAPQADDTPLPRPPRPKRAPTQPGITRVSLPLDDADDDGWSLPDDSAGKATTSAAASLVRNPGIAEVAERDVEAPGLDETTDATIEEQDDLAAEPTRVRPAPSRPPATIDTVPIEVAAADVDAEAIREDRDSDPPTPIDVDASEEIATSALGPGPAVPKLSVVASPSRTPLPAVPPPPPGARPAFPTPAPPPVPAPTAVGERDATAGRHKKPKPWWEDFFGEGYLRTLPRVTEEYTARECDFIEASLGVERGAKLLDLGCGEGRQAVSLAQRGYEMVGLDLSLAMLTRAQTLAEASSERINFMQADMRELTFDSAFDGILCMGTTFGLFDDETNVQVIKNIHRALKENGALLVEVANRDFVLRGQPNLIWFEGDGCVCMEETTVKYLTSRLHVKRTVILDDGGQWEAEYSVRLFSLHELGRLLHDHGFRVTEVSGHFSTRGAFFGFDSPRLIILAEKRAASETTSPGKSDRDSE